MIRVSANGGGRTWTRSLPTSPLFTSDCNTFKTCYKIPGSTQSQNEGTGKLGSAATVGNLWRIRLHPDKETGPWKITIRSTQTFTLKITGQSPSSGLRQKLLEEFWLAHFSGYLCVCRPEYN